MNNKQRRKAIEEFRCPHCNKQGAGFIYRIAVVLDRVYDAKKRHFVDENWEEAIEVIGKQPEFENQYKVLCQDCEQPIGPENHTIGEWHKSPKSICNARY